MPPPSSPEPNPSVGALPLPLRDVLGLVRGATPTLASLGDADLLIRGFASLAEALPGDLTFFANPKYLRATEATNASAVLVPNDFSASCRAVAVRVENPSLAFAQIVEALAPRFSGPEAGMHPTAVVHPEASVDSSASIGAHCVIEQGATVGRGTVLMPGVFLGQSSTIGADCLVYPNVSIRENCTIGDRVILQSGVVVGSDGFGYEFKDGRHVKIHQIGTVCIEDDVEIGANTTIDRARFGRTLIKRGTKIDNLVQIGHNVVIGRHCILVAGVAIAGSTVLGDYVTLGGQVGVAGHLTLGDRVMVGAKSGIGKSFPEGTVLFGTPAEPMREAKRTLGYIGMLGKLFARVRRLEEQLEAK